MKRTGMITLMIAILSLVLVEPTLQARPQGGQRQGGQRQGGQRPGGFGGAGGQRAISLVQLVAIEKVRKEAEILDEQEEDIRTAVEKVRQESRTNQGERPNFRELSEEQREELFKKFREQQEATNKKITAAVEDVLLPQQIERLNEIRLQIQGTGALLTEPVQKDLGITAEQKKEFEEISNGVREQSSELFSGVREAFSGGDREKAQAMMQEIREKMQKMQKESETKIVGVLTSEQKKKFDSMKGKPFEISQEELRPTRNRGGQGGQGGQRPGGQGGQRPNPQPGARPAT